MKKIDEFKKELEMLINKYSLENDLETPDFILSEYLVGCLENYNRILQSREILKKYESKILESNDECINYDDLPF